MFACYKWKSGYPMISSMYIYHSSGCIIKLANIANKLHGLCILIYILLAYIYILFLLAYWHADQGISFVERGLATL